MATASKRDVEILSQLIDDEQGFYRVRVGTRVHYLTTPSTVFDEDTMCRPYLLIPRLPDFPDSDWTRLSIDKDDKTGPLKTTFSTEPLPEIRSTWHSEDVDILSLPFVKRLRSGVHEVSYKGRPAVAKFACFNWDIRRTEREIWAYSVVEEAQAPDEPRISPNFLANLTENGRVMGFLMEKMDGDAASIDNLLGCEAVLKEIHRRGLIHGDPNRYNFLVDRASPGRVRMVDFEHAEEHDDALAQAELCSLQDELTEETGRGSTRIIVVEA